MKMKKNGLIFSANFFFIIPLTFGMFDCVGYGNRKLLNFFENSISFSVDDIAMEWH